MHRFQFINGILKGISVNIYFTVFTRLSVSIVHRIKDSYQRFFRVAKDFLFHVFFSRYLTLTRRKDLLFYQGASFKCLFVSKFETEKNLIYPVVKVDKVISKLNNNVYNEIYLYP